MEVPIQEMNRRDVEPTTGLCNWEQIWRQNGSALKNKWKIWEHWQLLPFLGLRENPVARPSPPHSPTLPERTAQKTGGRSLLGQACCSVAMGAEGGVWPAGSQLPARLGDTLYEKEPGTAHLWVRLSILPPVTSALWVSGQGFGLPAQKLAHTHIKSLTIKGSLLPLWILYQGGSLAK